MIRRSFRIGLRLGLLAGLVFALVKLLGSRSQHESPATRGPTEPWPPLVTAPAPPSPVAPVIEEVAPAKAWVDPDGSVCPTSHPVKAKLSSKIFHLPGMTNYERTRPDRCYADQASAEADGLRAAKR